jgi:outer membrane murein-binding lipoprotein Lpp
MRSVTASVLAVAALFVAGCQSTQQKHEDLSAQYQVVNAQYQKDCSATVSDQDANAVVGSALGGKTSPQQQAGIDQRQREAEALKSSPHCKDLEAKRDALTKKMLVQ